jgi:hypothetical protein
MAEAILNWDTIVHKNVRSKDMYDVGNVIQTTDADIVIMQGASRQYKVPKGYVEGFNGSEVYLDLTFRELLNYKVA